MAGGCAWLGACMERRARMAGACMAGGVGMHGRGRAWQGACMAGGYMHDRGVHGRGHERQGRQPLQRTVRILLECILVFKIFIPLRKE